MCPPVVLKCRTFRGWSCCKPRETHFDDFLNIRGCTEGLHQHVEKPKAEPKPPQPVDVRFKELSGAKEVYTTTAAKIGANGGGGEEPRKAAKAEAEVPDAADAKIAAGSPCLHNGCKATFADDKSRIEPCLYHSGVAIFHEGSKYWACCKKGCLEFEEMLQQPGCTTGKHKFVKDQPAQGQLVHCRVQSYQNATDVCINVFAKQADKERSRVIMTPDSVELDLVMNPDGTRCVKKWTLPAQIDAEKSSYAFFGSKVDLTLKKANADQWSLDMFK
jgi:cysteine/histidine-rich domain-containing protein 1